jgi:hypothetical protein
MATSLSGLRPAAARKATDDGVEGNERLTGLAGALLLLPLALEGLTIVRIGQMRWLHMFVGMLLFGPIAVKLASTGYRFASYYGGRTAYARKGPPVTALRLLAIPLVLSTVGVLTTGVLLLFEGPSQHDQTKLLHKVFFIIWVAVCAIHVLAHLAGSYRALEGDYGSLPTGTPRTSRRAARLLLLGAGVLVGVIIALVAVPSFGAWQSYHHGGH